MKLFLPPPLLTSTPLIFTVLTGTGGVGGGVCKKKSALASIFPAQHKKARITKVLHICQRFGVQEKEGGEKKARKGHFITFFKVLTLIPVVFFWHKSLWIQLQNLGVLTDFHPQPLFRSTHGYCKRQEEKTCKPFLLIFLSCFQKSYQHDPRTSRRSRCYRMTFSALSYSFTPTKGGTEKGKDVKLRATLTSLVLRLRIRSRSSTSCLKVGL